MISSVSGLHIPIPATASLYTGCFMYWGMRRQTCTGAQVHNTTLQHPPARPTRRRLHHARPPLPSAPPFNPSPAPAPILHPAAHAPLPAPPPTYCAARASPDPIPVLASRATFRPTPSPPRRLLLRAVLRRMYCGLQSPLSAPSSRPHHPRDPPSHLRAASC